jgi:hypothetical protein
MKKKLKKINKNPIKGRKCGAFESRLVQNFKRNRELHPNMTEIMNMCDFDFDYKIIYTYHKVSSIFQKHRRYMKCALEEFTTLIGTDNKVPYVKYLENGLSEKQIFNKFIEYCIDWDVIPVYADRDKDWRYYFLTLPAYMEMIDNRIMRVGKEFKNKVDSLRSLRDSFPVYTKRELLVIGHKPDELKDYLLGDGNNAD